LFHELRVPLETLQILRQFLTPRIIKHSFQVMLRAGQNIQLLLDLASIANLGFGAHILIISRLLGGLKRGLLFKRS
jgi:hypothetical protein